MQAIFKSSIKMRQNRLAAIALRRAAELCLKSLPWGQAFQPVLPKIVSWTGWNACPHGHSAFEAKPPASAKRKPDLIAAKSTHDQRRVLAAEAEAVAEDVIHALLARRVRDVIEIAFRIGCFIVDRRRQHAALDRQDRRDQLHRAG